MSAEIMQKVGEDVGIFMKDFTIEYIKALINSKLEGAMDEAVETVLPSGLAEAAAGGGDDDEAGDDVVEQKGDDEKEQGKPIAAGVKLRGYRLATGPDRAAHRYYDLACFAIKPQDSVICKTVYKHSQLTRFIKTFTKNNADIPKDAEWPKKKTMGKDNEYYRNRYAAMETYWTKLSSVHAVSTNDEFLKFFNLQYDPDRADQLEIFFAAIEGYCDNNGVSFQRAQKTAERLGFDLDECEMLKVVAVEKIGREASRNLRSELSAKIPSVAPAKVQNKFYNATESKLAGVIASGVEAGWNAAKETFKKIIEALSAALDKGMEPIKELFNKALEPIGKLIKEKFAKASEAKGDDEADKDTLEDKVNISRFPPLKAALESIEKGDKAVDACEKLIENINTMSECHKFVGYLMYNLGDPEYGQYIPFLDEIQDNHYRLVIALTDLCYLLGRAAARAFRPLCKFIDFTADSGFADAKEFETLLANAIRESGASLAEDYFDLPYQTRRMSWRLPNSVTSRLLALGQTTIQQVADLLGGLGANWRPTSKDDAKATFVKTFAEPLDSFIQDRVKLWSTVVRRGSEAVIADMFMGKVEDAIAAITDPLNELCSALPDPLGENLKAGDIVAYLLNKCAENCIVKVVAMIAKKTESTLFDCAKFAEEQDKDFVWRLRYRPYIRPDNYDPSEPAEDSGDDDKDDKDAGNNGDAPAVTKQLTNDNTPDSDEEDAAKPKE